MMHKKNFVAAIKVDGKVLRESSERVEIPFGSEYSVLLKNLDTVRMQAQISIDGEPASSWLVISPGQSVDVERFYRGNNSQGNRFKFIERTQRIEEHRGVQAEDGLVRVEFKREKVYELPKVVEHHTYHHYDDWPYYSRRLNTWTPNWTFCGTLGQSNSSQKLISNTGVGGQSVQSSFNVGFAGISVSKNEAGITVPGGISNQKFISVAGFECEASEAIVLHLVGRSGGQSVRVAKTVDKKPICETCGKKNKGTSKFCAECGTSLEKFRLRSSVIY